MSDSGQQGDDDSGSRDKLAISVKYLGLKDAPLWLVGSGRYPSSPPAQAVDRSLPNAASIYLGGDGPTLHLSIKQAEQERVLGQVRTRLHDLAETIDNLSLPANDQPGTAVSAVSSQPQAVQAQASDDATTGVTHDLAVKGTSHPAQVLGKPQNPVAQVDLANGSHSFTVTVDGQEHQLSVWVNNSASQVDTQEELLGRLATVISRADSRVSAQVVYGRQDAHDPSHRLFNRTATLVIQASGPDRGVDFSLQDSVGQVVQAYGLNTQVPSGPTSLNLDGLPSLQDSSTLSLDEGRFTLSALATTEGAAQVSVQAGAGTITGQVNSLLGQYNSLVQYLDSHADLLRPSLKDRLTRPLEELAGALPSLGLKATGGGQIKTTSRFGQKLTGDFGQVRQTLLEGWAAGLRTKIGQVLAMDTNAFAAPLADESLSDQRRRAWQTLEETVAGIINRYC